MQQEMLFAHPQGAPSVFFFEKEHKFCVIFVVLRCDSRCGAVLRVMFSAVRVNAQLSSLWIGELVGSIVNRLLMRRLEKFVS